MIRSSQLDSEFAHEVMQEPGGENLLACWNCGTCASTCIVRRFEPSFNPRRILHMAGMGMREQVLSSKEIWLCSACDACYPRCPKEIHISDVMKALRNIAIREGYSAPGSHAEVDLEKCSGCAVCTRACPYGAIERVPQMVNGEEKMAAKVDPNLCMSCGVCVASCPSGAMSLEDLNDSEIVVRMASDDFLEKPGFLAGATEEPRLLAFVCQWAVHSENEWDRIQELENENLHLVKLPCSGRVDPSMILMALTKGVDGVMVIGCLDGECHYQRGTYLGRSKVALLSQIFEQLSIAPERVQFHELGSLDRGKLPGLLKGLSDDIKATVQVTA